MNQDNIFINNLELLQAISDWQLSSNESKGERLSTLAKELPLKYRTLQVGLTCYRRIDLENWAVWNLVAKNELIERISSWTIQPDFAKKFNNGVPNKNINKQGVIFKIIPEDVEVILNLNALYLCPNFVYALEHHKTEIKNYEMGAGEHGNNELEVILKIKSLDQDNIYSFGGYSSFSENDIHNISNFMGINLSDRSSEIDHILSYTEDNGWWLSENSTKNVLKRTINKAQIKKLF